MDESSCQISAIVFTSANSYGSHSVVFLRILFHIQLLKQTQNPSKTQRLDFSLVDFSEILKIISDYIFCWKVIFPVSEMSMGLVF